MQIYVPIKKINAEYFRNTVKYTQRSCLAGKNLRCAQQHVYIVTACMNRLEDLKKTLPANLRDNKDYDKLTFILLDYNSSDGLADWIRSEMIDHIRNGRLQFYQTKEPKWFQPNHSRNVMFKLCGDGIVANVDSDNFTHHGYAARINECFANTNGKVLAVPDNFLLPGTKRLCLKGRFAMYKRDIIELGGFDEDLDEGFGNDDMNFVLRAMLAGFRIVRFESEYTEDRLPTTDEERVRYVRNTNLFEMQQKNNQITWNKLSRCQISVNKNLHWGKAYLIKNFREKIHV